MAKASFYKDEYYPYYDITTEDQGDVHVDVPEAFLNEFQQVMMRFILMQDIIENLENGTTTDAHTEDASKCWCNPMVIRGNNIPEVWEHRR